MCTFSSSAVYKTKSMEQSPFWEAYSRSTGQEITRFFIKSESWLPCSQDSSIGPLLSHLNPGLPSGLSRSGFLLSSCVLHAPWFPYHPNNIRWIVQVMKLLIMQSPPASCHFLPRRSKYSPQHPVLNITVLPSFWATDQVPYSIQNKRQNNNLFNSLGNVVFICYCRAPVFGCCHIFIGSISHLFIDCPALWWGHMDIHLISFAIISRQTFSECPYVSEGISTRSASHVITLTVPTAPHRFHPILFTSQ